MNTEQIINKFIRCGVLDMDNINSTNLFKAGRMLSRIKVTKSLPACSIEYFTLKHMRT